LNDRVSIVIVTYNSERVLGPCLHSLAGAGSEVIVVDNASRDDSTEAARRAGAYLIANARNRGFATAANQGAQAASGDSILLLNPDTVVVEGLDCLVAALNRNPAAGAVAGVLVDSVSRQPQRGFSVRRFPTFSIFAFEVLGINKIWPGNPVNAKYRCLDLDLGQSQEIDQPAGACLMFRKSVWEALQGFDESFYPLWFEDVDFCLRLRRTGLKILLEPNCRLLHQGGHSLETIGFTERQLYWYGNLFYYVRKNIGYAYTLGIRALVCFGACGRIAVAMLSGRFGQIEAFRAVIRLAVSGKRNV
jgi:GT2 family glycosyltransferase